MKNGDHLRLGPLWTDLAKRLLSRPETDVIYFNNRLHQEGIGFLTKTLPALGKDLDKALISGEPFILTARFDLYSGSKLPTFLNTEFYQIFNKEGLLRENVDPLHIKVVRQLTLMFYKLEVDYEEDLLKSAYADFRTRDTALNTPLRYVGVADDCLQRAGTQLCRVLPQRGCKTAELVPRHGPGATACRTRPWDKYHKALRFVERLHKVYPYEELFFFNASHLSDELPKLLEGVDLPRPVARITAVPKDSRGPRLICMEPREHQYVQQGLMRRLYNIVENHPLTRGRVNFTDQTVNQRLARESSITMEYATLDLKDASDLVRWDLVSILFPFLWVRAFYACRTEYIEFPDGSIFGPLEKFAPMGSAVCFPVEALVFWALISGNICTDVYVYGDDIILPTEHVERAIALLEEFSLKVNIDKSCFKTHFRESCGGDYFNGFDIGYVKVRRLIENTINSHLSFVGFVNEVIKHFGEHVAQDLMHLGDTYYGIHFRTLEDLPLSYRHSFSASNDVFFKRRYNRHLCKYEYRVPIVRSRIRRLRTNPKYHWCELLRKSLIDDVTMKVGEYADGTCTIKEAWRGDL